jgi:hypothetical protein
MRPQLRITYGSMKNIENMDEHKISVLRVILLGFFLLLWKKKHLYTVIEYDDGNDEQAIVMDFGKEIDRVQPFVYQKMLSTRDMLQR